MSRRTSAGSRFQALPIEGDDDSDSDQGIPVPRYLSESEDLSRYLPATSGAGPSGLQRSTSSRPSAGEASGLHFVWGHFRYDSYPSDEGIDDLEDSVFNQTAEELDTEEGEGPIAPPTNIEQDVAHLKRTGFIIEYPDGEIGQGSFGVVFKGYYGQDAKNIGTNGFAVKVVDFGDSDDPDTLIQRQMFETEKWVLTTASHRNIVSIRMIINMGEVRSFPFKSQPKNQPKNEPKKFLSPERVYMIMDFAEGGDLDTWLEEYNEKMKPLVRINIGKDMFKGMLYLHLKNITHSDVHIGNVLLFREKRDRFGKKVWVAKWSDFGMSFVAKGQYEFRDPSPRNFKKEVENDISKMAQIYSILMDDRPGRESKKETKLIEQLDDMFNTAVIEGSLLPAFEQFKKILI